MSEREELARRIYDRAIDSGRFGGPIRDIGKMSAGAGQKSYWQITLMIPRLLDMEIRVYSKTFMLVRRSNTANYVLKSEDEAYELLENPITYPWG